MSKYLYGLLLLIFSCTSSKDHPMEELLSEAALSGAEGPLSWVEAFIEFSGPEDRWAGPPSLVFRIEAPKGGELALVQTNFDIPLAPKLVPADGRALAKADEPKLMANQVRIDLAAFARMIEQAPLDEKAGACLYPLRARVMRADGAILEKTGCRGNGGWTRTAGFLVDHYLAQR